MAGRERYELLLLSEERERGGEEELSVILGVV